MRDFRKRMRKKGANECGAAAALAQRHTLALVGTEPRNTLTTE